VRYDNDLDWQDEALCRGLSVEIFFPREDDEDTQALAKAICDHCPVRVKCAIYALHNPELEGIWGGLTEKDRRKKKRNRNQQARRDRVREQNTGMLVP